MTASVKYIIEQRRLQRNSRCLSADSDSLYLQFNSNRQSELKFTHANVPCYAAAAALPRFKNFIFRHHYFMQKTAVVLRLSKVTLTEFFTSATKTEC